MTKMQNSDLDDLLGQAARNRPTPSTNLMDRVLADALTLQPQAQPVARTIPAAMPTTIPAANPGWLARLAAAFGGVPVFAGVCTAMVVGLAVGYLNPSTLDYLTGGLASAELGADMGTETGTFELFPTTEFLATEG
jgi:hypothetical protein